MKNILLFSRLIGLAALITTSLYYYFLFYRAYFHKSKSVTMEINYFGEANLEIIVFSLFIPFIFFNLYHVLKGIKEAWK